jgi:hypothetical protein
MGAGEQAKLLRQLAARGAHYISGTCAEFCVNGVGVKPCRCCFSIPNEWVLFLAELDQGTTDFRQQRNPLDIPSQATK